MRLYQNQFPSTVMAVQYHGQDDFPLSLCRCPSSEVPHVHYATGTIKTVRPSDWAIFADTQFLYILSHFQFTDVYVPAPEARSP